MSRLDSMIRRLTAHRAAIEWSAGAVAGVDGPMLEVGLGNGRTYDHLRETFAGREIWVIERHPAPHPDCWPPEHLLVIGEADAAFARFAADGRRFALINYDLGSGDKAFTLREAERFAPILRDALTPGGVLLSVQPMPPTAGLAPAPAEAAEAFSARIHAFRRAD